MKNISQLKELKDQENRKEFGKKILTLVPRLQPYVKHRLYVASMLGVLPKKMFRSLGIIDEVILKLFESEIDTTINTTKLKIKLFTLTNEYLNTLFSKEEWHKKSISIGELLKNEKSTLEEKYTVDGDYDFIMKEDLDDISYHQNDTNPNDVMYDKSNQVLKSFDIKIDIAQNERNAIALGKIYAKLPLETTNIIDLFVFGKLNTKEISTVCNLTTKEVKNILDHVKNNFTTNIVI